MNLNVKNKVSENISEYNLDLRVEKVVQQHYDQVSAD